MYHLWVALRMKFQCFFSYIWSIIDINANCLRLAFCTCVMSVKTNNSGLFPHSCSTMSIVFKKWMLINRKQCIVSHVQKHRLPRHFYSPENPRLRLSRTWVPGLSDGVVVIVSQSPWILHISMPFIVHFTVYDLSCPESAHKKIGADRFSII